MHRQLQDVTVVDDHAGQVFAIDYLDGYQSYEYSGSYIPEESPSTNTVTASGAWVEDPSVIVVECGNVPGIEPGSESPVTPYNYIMFTGTGSLVGIGGNKVDYGTVCFDAIAQDRNEPGNENALLPDGGHDVDRYYLSVYTCGDPGGELLVFLCRLIS